MGRRWVTPQNFFLAFTDTHEKQNNFDIYIVEFFLKNKEKHLEMSSFYTCVPKILMI